MQHLPKLLSLFLIKKLYQSTSFVTKGMMHAAHNINMIWEHNSVKLNFSLNDIVSNLSHKIRITAHGSLKISPICPKRMADIVCL